MPSQIPEELQRAFERQARRVSREIALARRAAQYAVGHRSPEGRGRPRKFEEA